MSSTEPASHRTALLDACTLVPIRLATTLLWLAEARLFELLWSDAILDEVERNLPKLGVSPERAGRRVAMMRDAFGAAALVDDFEHLIADMTCDPKDRHVLAAAVRGTAGTLVTFNLKDFPPESVARHGVEVVHPDLFLTRLLTENPEEVIAALERGVAELHRPALMLREFLASLTTTVPMFANFAADAALDPPTPLAPVPAVVSADEDEAIAAFGELGDLTNPAQVALLWTIALTENVEAARALSFDASAWGDYSQARATTADRGLASKVLPAIDAPDRVAYMRMIDAPPESSSQVFAPSLASVTILTLVRVEDYTWRVFALGPAMPAARDVLGDRLAEEDFVVGGGTGLVLEWLTGLVEPDPPVALIWGSLDDPLRLAFTQGWLMGVEHPIVNDIAARDELAQALSARDGTHELFDDMFAALFVHLQNVYRDVDGKPCLVGMSETVGPDLELIAFSSEEFVGTHDGDKGVPVHSFITRHLGGDEWVIAANARRLPIPGWPPTEQTLPGLLIDGN